MKVFYIEKPLTKKFPQILKHANNGKHFIFNNNYATGKITKQSTKSLQSEYIYGN